MHITDDAVGACGMLATGSGIANDVSIGVWLGRAWGGDRAWLGCGVGGVGVGGASGDGGGVWMGKGMGWVGKTFE